jgi:hypothetical protein
MTTTMRMLWLELGTRCQLECGHCYNNSGPHSDTGVMTASDWARIITQGAALGVRMVQFIGGEPTLYPDLPDLIRHARREGVEVEVYSNLVKVPAGLWPALQMDGVRVATSFYSDDRAEHQRITGRDTLRQTCSNISRALEMGIPLRAGIVSVLDGQRTAQAKTMLTRMGVREIGVDQARPFGRAAGDQPPTMSGLCGRCGNGCAAVLADGSVAPCPMSRWLADGDVLTEPLPRALARVTAAGAAIATKVGAPSMCGPDNDGQCHPCEPSCNPGCDPSAEITAGGVSWVRGSR